MCGRALLHPRDPAPGCDEGRRCSDEFGSQADKTRTQVIIATLTGVLTVPPLRAALLSHRPNQRQPAARPRADADPHE